MVLACEDNPGADIVTVAVTEEAFNALTEAVAANDYQARVTELLVAGKAFTVRSGSHVRILERTLFRTKVRMLDGKQIGMSGWVRQEWVKP